MSLRTCGSSSDVKRTKVYSPEEAYLSRILAVNVTGLHMAVVQKVWLCWARQMHVG